MAKFKVHMVKFGDDEGSFTTFCGINDYNCSEQFKDDGEVVECGDVKKTTCKRCLAMHKQYDKDFQAYLETEIEKLNDLAVQ